MKDDCIYSDRFLAKQTFQTSNLKPFKPQTLQTLQTSNGVFDIPIFRDSSNLKLLSAWLD